METSPHSTSSSTSSSGSHTATLPTATTSTATPLLPSPKPITRSDSNNPYPTTFVQADSSSFKQVVQMLTGSPKPTANLSDPSPNPNSKPHSHNFNIPPIKSIPKKNQSSSGFKLYERRNSLKNLKINPIFNPQASGFSPRKPEILSPSVLDFPALVLSPVTPLIPDPFDRSGSVTYGSTNNKTTCFSPISINNNRTNGVKCNNGLVDCDAEDRAIKEKGFFMHPSPREAEPPRLLPLFPVTSPRVSGSADS